MKYSELRKQILSLLSQPPYRYNIPYLARHFNVHRTVIHKVIKPLENKGLIIREKYDGMTWISLHHKTLFQFIRREVDFHTRKIWRSKRLILFGMHSSSSTIVMVDFGKEVVDLIYNKRVSQTSSKNCERGVIKSITAFTTNCVVDGSGFHNSCVGLGGPVHNDCVGSRVAASQLRFPRRAHWARAQAFRILVRRRQLTIYDWVLLNRLFNAYLDDTGHRVIILFDEYEGKTLWLGYRHRFTKSGLKKLIRKFNSVFDKANKYKYGIWLTLTVDPKKYRNVIEMRYELQKAWNRFMSYIRKKYGTRSPYLRVIEFTKTGLVHYHVLLLGVRRLLPRDYIEARLSSGRIIWASSREELKERLKKMNIDINKVKIIYHKESFVKMLEQWGFGKINYMYLVVNRNGKWIPKKLFEAQQAKGDIKADGAGLPSNLRSYLKKYLTKAFQDLDMDSMTVEIDKINPISLYWALNSRFFTYSKTIKPEPEIGYSKVIIGDRVLSYRFLGTGYIVNPNALPLETEKPPWEYFIDLTYPPIYDPTLEI